MNVVAEDYITKGRKLLYDGFRKEAIESFTNALELKPDDDNLLILRGQAKHGGKDYAGALEDFSKAIAINPKNIMAYYNRTFTYSALKMFDKALDDSLAIVNLDPNSFIGNSSVESYQFRLGDEQESEKFEQKCLEITPMDYEGFYQRAICKQFDDFNGAIQDITEAIRISLKNTAIAYELRASIKQDNNDYSGAIEDYQKAIEIDFDDVYYYSYYLEIGKCYEQLGEFEKAIEYYSLSCSSKYEYCWAFQQRGELRIKMGKIKEGEEDIKKAEALRQEYIKKHKQ